MPVPAHPDFNPRPSYEGRLSDASKPTTAYLFQSTPLIRGATRHGFHHRYQLGISIHAPHTRGDRSTPICSSTMSNFNPRPSYEGRLGATDGLPGDMQFQSTPLIRGATYEVRAAYHTDCISIHAPHTRGDVVILEDAIVCINFNPRPSYEGRRWHNLCQGC